MKEPLTMDLFGWNAPIALVAVLVAGVFALVNSWVSESLKRLWVRGDRIRLLRSEYLHIRRHYQVTLRLWERGNLNGSAVRQAKYGEDGFLSDDVEGLASLYPELLHTALLLKGTIRRSNALVEAKASALVTDSQRLLPADAMELRKRLQADMRRVGKAYLGLPPEWVAVSIWHRSQLLLRFLRYVLALRPGARSGANKHSGEI